MKYIDRYVNTLLNTFVPDLSRGWLAGLMAVVAIMTGVFDSVQAQDRPSQFDLLPPTGAIANCIPNGRATVTVFPKEEKLGTDTLQLRASGLIPNVEVTVFLTELAAPPFGAVEYLGDFSTNNAGEGSFRTNTIINEAFASVLVGSTRVRTDLNHVVLWFADPADDDRCFAPNTGPITPFDGDGEAGVTILSSAHLLPASPLP